MRTKQRKKTERVLVTAHAHPDFSLGGGEIAAYNLFKAYRELPDVEDAWFLGRADRGRGRGPSGHISLRRENEYLWEQGVSDWHTMKAAHLESVLTRFADLIRSLRPTVVHAHHYAHLGLEHFRVIKQIDPSIKLYLTLHEYMAICANNGQMVKTGSLKLCSRASPDECRQCFPDKSAEDFWLRKHAFMSAFDLVDHFISPSEFLKERYVAWGIDPRKITVIENGQPTATPRPPRALKEGETRNRFGYFGQINPYKGLDVILKAIKAMPEETREKIVLEVHGANLEQQPQKFRDTVGELLEELSEEGVVQWMGPYDADQLHTRMAGVDWVLVPSQWWENSPMVIQEAYVHGRPVVTSDMGGMKEKVQDGVTGFRVPAGSIGAWQSKLEQLGAATPELWTRIAAAIQPPIRYELCAKRHAELLFDRNEASLAASPR